MCDEHPPACWREPRPCPERKTDRIDESDAPRPWEQPDDDEPTQREIIQRADELTEQAQQRIFPAFTFDRAEQASIPEDAFWELQTCLGLEEDLCANEGARSFITESTRELTPLGHVHRYHIREQLSIDTIRDMYYETIQRLLAETTSRSEYLGEAAVAIDTTADDPSLAIERATRTKSSAQRRTTDRGTDIGLVIDQPAGLSAGDVVLYDDERMVVITAEQQEVAVLDIAVIENRETAIELGHHLGNQHWTLTIRNGRLYVPVPEKRAHVERAIEGILGDVPVEYEQVEPAIVEENAQPNHHNHEHTHSDHNHRHGDEQTHSHVHYE